LFCRGDGIGRDAEVDAGEIEEGTAVAGVQDGEFDLRGLQLCGDDEWAALELGFLAVFCKEGLATD
jgi:hypothetical protein